MCYWLKYNTAYYNYFGFFLVCVSILYVGIKQCSFVFFQRIQTLCTPAKDLPSGQSRQKELQLVTFETFTALQTLRPGSTALQTLGPGSTTLRSLRPGSTHSDSLRTSRIT